MCRECNSTRSCEMHFFDSADSIQETFFYENICYTGNGLKLAKKKASLSILEHEVLVNWEIHITAANGNHLEWIKWLRKWEAVMLTNEFCHCWKEWWINRVKNVLYSSICGHLNAERTEQGEKYNLNNWILSKIYCSICSALQPNVNAVFHLHLCSLALLLNCKFQSPPPYPVLLTQLFSSLL